MAIFKCKMCGGALEITEGITVAECEYCGTNQTVPTADNDKKMNLFARANRLRAACEFDKAASIYESIVAEFPEEPEAYWGLVLCEYGIEYVDDPATGKKVPTCHRSAFDSVMKNTNVEMAQEYADITAKRIYREEAKQIEELRRNIISVSESEEPYDIFICYKENDFDGKRTLDSVLAQDIYDALTAKKYRVFFSRISLEDKLGVEFEPYIFAALNSAKIMLVIGTDYEYLTAVWVKNEWSRFLKLMAKDKQKHLVPCYKGIDAYDMPEEFARLQAQDLDKMGAIQDILRGVEKLLPQDNKVVAKPVETQTVIANSNANPSVDSYLKRVFIFLEDGDFKSADEYCEKVLDIDPENAQAYLGKLMAELHTHTSEELKNLNTPFDSRNNYLKIKRYGDADLITKLESYAACINSRIEQVRKAAEEARKAAEEARKATEQAKIKAQEEARRKLEAINEKRCSYNKLQSFISAGDFHTIALKSDGTVVAFGYNEYFQCNVGYGTYIIAVAAGSLHTIALKTDGTVITVGQNHFGQCMTNDWNNIVAVSAGDSHTVGLKSDGTVIATGYNQFNQCNVSDWDNIIAVAAGNTHTVGLKADGTVIATGNNSNGSCNIDHWKHIIAIDASADHTIGLKADGTVTAAGSNEYGQSNINDWTDIIAVSTNEFHTVGLKSDGTVVTTGYNQYNQCNVSDWDNIVAVSAGLHHTVGLKSDGTLVAAGNNHHGQCNVNGIRLFANINSIKQERNTLMQAAHTAKENLMKAGRCLNCGGKFKGLFTPKCINCGREKDY